MLRSVAVLFLATLGAAQSQPAITIYNQNFAVVRETVPMDLKPGRNEVTFDRITSFLEPDSVILRDPASQRTLAILEQNYRSDVVSQESLMRLNEGKVIDFLVQRPNGATEIVKGRIVRAGATAFSPFQNALYGYNNNYYPGNNPFSAQPIIEIDGHVQFSLPGMPLFPSTADQALRPTVNWTLQTDKPGPFSAELSYVTGGMTWNATYNIVIPEKSDLLNLIGWVTLDNHTGTTFENARLQLMAGDVNKMAPNAPFAMAKAAGVGGAVMDANGIVGMPGVKERSFDEYHLYTLPYATTLHNGETKQAEFLRGHNIPSKRVYVYEGFRLDPSHYAGQQFEYIREQRQIGMTTNTNVYVMREFKNSEANHLGVPLPRGRMRFYRQDDAGRLQFIGENTIEHTPKDETLRVYTGDAFDIKAERRRTNFKIDNNRDWLDESYEIKLRNHKKEAVTVAVVEHFYRGDNWEITSKSADFVKKASHTAEFKITIPPDGEQTLIYSVHYTW